MCQGFGTTPYLNVWRYTLWLRRRNKLGLKSVIILIKKVYSSVDTEAISSSDLNEDKDTITIAGYKVSKTITKDYSFLFTICKDVV